MITPASPLLSIPAYRLAGTAFASSCFKVFPTPLLFVVLVMLARLLLSIVAVLPTFFLPVRVFTAVQAMKAAHITRPNCRFCMGIPVSAVSCPRGPSPVATSPSSAATKPSCASRPANSSFCAVKPQSVTPKNFLTWNRVTLGLPRGPSAASAWFAATCSGLKVADLGSRPATRLKPTRPARNRPTCASGRSYR
eukprot:GHRQ01001202.1.p3 GENE.GHRQ01001202.1~~GHRQ01001202.1.p3  ORF type:complete len:194 (-),score=29.97 GHRQ01001202.1:463-1044(-)